MKNKTLLITGGTSGIGLATAQLLLAEGARVIVTGRNPEALAAARRTLGPSATVLSSDAGSTAEAQGLGDAVRAHAPALDGVLLNAGTGQFGPIEAMTPALFEAMFGVNVRGLYFQLQSLLPLLANPSSVVLISSVVARLGLAATSVYSATKAAVSSLGRTLAAELAPRGVRVNTISPGPIATPIFGKMGMSPDAQRDFASHMASQTLSKRLGTPEEVARLARFLLSGDSANIIGEEILIDGGTHLT